MIYDSLAYNRYVQRPYLAKAAEELVTHRHNAICTNLWTSPPPGSPQLHPDPRKLSFWAAKLTEVRTERFMRARKAGVYRGPPAEFVSFDETRLLSDANLDPRIIDRVRRLTLPSSPFLVRFTAASYVKDAMTYGRFRIAPAAEYDDPSLNAAQRDDELSHAGVRGDRHIAAQIIGYRPGEDPAQAHPMPVEWREMFQYMNSVNFYVLCLTNQFDARMFADFAKDAALIIRDPPTYLSRLRQVTQHRHPSLHFRSESVRYYDPYTVTTQDLLPGFSKNFSFSYQSEFRPTWWPRNPSERLSPFFIEIGNMTDIAEVILL